MSKKKNVFGRAADQFRDRGWVRGSATGPKGQVCAITALGNCGSTLEQERVFLNAADRLYPKPSGTSWGSIPAFNDASGRTGPQVMHVMRTAEQEFELSG
jgi:hypothetical protein